MEVGMYVFKSEQMKEEKEGDEQAVLGRGAEVTWLPRERDGLTEEGVFGESHAAGARAGCEINCQLSQT